MHDGRHTAIDLLRIIAALGVVFIHVTSPFVVHNMRLVNADFWSGNIINSLGRFSVPIFVLLSGYFILKPADSLKSFYKKRFTRILWPFLLWSAIYIAWALLFDGTKPSKVLDMLLWGKPYFHLWFIGMLLGLYAAAPFLADVKQRVGAKNFMLLGLLLLAIAMGTDWWDSHVHNRIWVGMLWAYYVGYFMIGACLNDFPEALNRKWLLLALALACFITTFLATGLLFTNGYYTWYFYSYLSITTVVGSIVTTNLFRGIKLGASPKISTIADLTFGVYLIHIIPLGLTKRYLKLDLVDNPYLNLLLISLVVFVTSLLIAWGITKVKLLKKVLI